MAAQQKSPDQVAKSLGFPSAAAMIAWQQRQQQIQDLPAQTMQPQQKAAQPSQAQSFIDHILSYLPLASAMKKAGNAMSK